MYPHDCAEYERSLSATRSALGKELFQTLWEEGKATPPVQTAGDTSEQAHSDGTSPEAGESSNERVLTLVSGHDDLSSREREVLQLIALGLTNDQIARRLVISSHTVNNHLRSIFRKLGVGSRSAATRYAVLNKLV
jgi:DNA-binding CsgD family transcriptional regulator